MGAACTAWIVSILLIAPVIYFDVAHYAVARSHGLEGTGFIHADMATYLAHAREHFDSGRFTLTYGNSCDEDPDTPRIYFQPMMLGLAAVWYITGCDPGALFIGFGLVAAVVFVRLAMSLFGDLYGLDSLVKRLVFLCFVWGGGLTLLTGLAGNLIAGDALFDQPFRFDADNGWWGLSLGRPLILPNEALYHALVFGCVLTLGRRKFVAASVLMFLLSLSHPFTGAQFLLIFMIWTLIEKYYVRGSDMPQWFLITIGVLVVWHFSYYLVFLNLFPVHKSMSSQWHLPWVYHAREMLPAYALVGGAALLGFRRPRLAREVLSVPFNRLFVVWFVVSFGLANHEFAMTPTQPLHFTRGYVWTSLFLLAAPTLIDIFDRVWKRWPVAVIVLLALFLMDNVVWYVRSGQVPNERFHMPLFLHPTQAEALEWLRSVPSDSLLVSADPTITSLAVVYTPLRSWYSHWGLTPLAQQRQDEITQFLSTGSFPPSWHQRPIVVIESAGISMTPHALVNSDLGLQETARNEFYRMLQSDGARRPSGVSP